MSNWPDLLSVGTASQAEPFNVMQPDCLQSLTTAKGPSFEYESRWYYCLLHHQCMADLSLVLIWQRKEVAINELEIQLTKYISINRTGSILIDNDWHKVACEVNFVDSVFSSILLLFDKLVYIKYIFLEIYSDKEYLKHHKGTPTAGGKYFGVKKKLKNHT